MSFFFFIIIRWIIRFLSRNFIITLRCWTRWGWWLTWRWTCWWWARLRFWIDRFFRWFWWCFCCWGWWRWWWWWWAVLYWFSFFWFYGTSTMFWRLWWWTTAITSIRYWIWFRFIITRMTLTIIFTITTFWRGSCGFFVNILFRDRWWNWWWFYIITSK